MDWRESWTLRSGCCLPRVALNRACCSTVTSRQKDPLLSIESAKTYSSHESFLAVDLFLLDRAMSKLPRLDNTHVSSDIAKERFNSQAVAA